MGYPVSKPINTISEFQAFSMTCKTNMSKAMGRGEKTPTKSGWFA
jgi:hypothetical protein